MTQSASLSTRPLAFQTTVATCIYRNLLAALCGLIFCLSVCADAQAQLSGTGVNVPVQGTEYSRGAKIVLNNSGLLTFIANDNRIEQGVVPTVSEYFPGSFTPSDGGKFGPSFYYITPGGSLAVVAHTTSVLQTGIYFVSGSTVRKVAATGDAAPGGGIFSTFSKPAANDAGQVVFSASTQGGPGSGVFVGDSDGLHAIALYTGTAPGGMGTFTGFSDGVLMTASGKAIFYASTTGGVSFYAGTTSALSQIPLTSTASNLFANDADQVMFQAGGDLYVGSLNSSHRIVAVGGTAPGGGTFTSIQNPVLNDVGEVAFSARLTGSSDNQGVFLWTPTGIKSIARGDLAPGGGTFQTSALYNAVPVLNSQGQVAFVASTNSGARIFLGDGTDLIKVVGVGDIVSNLAVQNVVLAAPEDAGSGHSAFNNQGQLAYDVVFRGSGGYYDEIYVFTVKGVPAITSASAVSSPVNAAFSYQVTASNSATSYNANGLPEGLRIDPATGLISGTPTVPGVYTVALSATNSSGIGTLSLTLTVVSPGPVVSLAATTNTVVVGSGGIGVFTVSLSAPQADDLTVYYTVKGSAANGADYLLLTGKKKFKPGKTSKPIKIIPEGDLGGASKKTVILTLLPGDGYTVGTTDKVKVKILGQ